LLHARIAARSAAAEVCVGAEEPTRSSAATSTCPLLVKLENVSSFTFARNTPA
jgi:hypothetical protein